MRLYEFEGKQLFRKFRIPVPEGSVVKTAEDAATAAKQLGGKVIVKSQVLTGGRGKAGGIKLAESPDEAKAVATELLGMKIKGYPVEQLLV